MKKSALLSLPILLSVLSATSPQQKPKYPSPPPPLSAAPESTAPAKPTTLRKHLDLIQLQNEADDLARTAQTIPTDVGSVRKGMLPKDMIQKLKQIEKLSKRLRSELNP